MKKRIPTFLAGMLTTAIIGTLSIGTLAATGALTISVNPINVQVNGQTFQPKDAKGNDVPVFAYNGTTYAPLRALAEAYGLEVGYDKEKNMATVGEKGSGQDDVSDDILSAIEENAYNDLISMEWVADTDELGKNGFLNLVYTEKNNWDTSSVCKFIDEYNDDTIKKASEKYARNLFNTHFKPAFGDQKNLYTITFNISINGKYIALWDGVMEPGASNFKFYVNRDTIKARM